MPDSTSQSITVSLVSGCGAKTFATFSADQCLPARPKLVSTLSSSRLWTEQQLVFRSSTPSRALNIGFPGSGLTKVRRAWVGNIVDIVRGILKIPLLECNTNGQDLISDSPVAFLPRMGLAISLLMKTILAARCWSRGAGENESRRGCCG